MKILGLDTTRKNALVFIVDSGDDKKAKVFETGENIKHSEGIFLFIEKLLVETGLSMEEIDAFACIVGPGSFTGIRVGMSIIKGFSKVYGKPVIALNMFDVLKSSLKNGIILLNSTSTSCYYSKVDKSQLGESGVVEKDKISQLGGNGEVVVLEEEQKVIGVEYNNCKIIDNLDSYIVAAIKARLNSMDYGEFVPYYLQLSQAERNLK